MEKKKPIKSLGTASAVHFDGTTDYLTRRDPKDLRDHLSFWAKRGQLDVKFAEALRMFIRDGNS